MRFKLVEMLGLNARLDTNINRKTGTRIARINDQYRSRKPVTFKNTYMSIKSTVTDINYNPNKHSDYNGIQYSKLI